MEEFKQSIRTYSVSKGSPYPKPLVVPASISETEGVKRLQHVIRNVLDTEQFMEFAFFVNDHTYVIPENLCSWLMRYDPAMNLYAGHALYEKRSGKMFNSGASGYVLSKTTMQNIVNEWDAEPTNPNCQISGLSKWLDNNPGLVTAKCLFHALDCQPMDTRDEEGSQRFHAFGLARVVTGKVDGWYFNKHEQLDFGKGTEDVNDHLPNGRRCCSSETISFHYVEAMETYALFQLLSIGTEEMNRLSDTELGTIVMNKWPERKDLGYYAHPLPIQTDKFWKDTLAVIRKISFSGGSKLKLPMCNAHS